MASRVRIFKCIYCTKLEPISETNDPEQVLSQKNLRFVEFEFKPYALLESLEGRTPREQRPFLFSEKTGRAQNQKYKESFSLGVAGVFASALGRNRTYDLLDRNQTLYPLSYKRKTVYMFSV